MTVKFLAATIGPRSDLGLRGLVNRRLNQYAVSAAEFDRIFQSTAMSDFGFARQVSPRTQFRANYSVFGQSNVFYLTGPLPRLFHRPLRFPRSDVGAKSALKPIGSVLISILHQPCNRHRTDRTLRTSHSPCRTASDTRSLSNTAGCGPTASPSIPSRPDQRRRRSIRADFAGERDPAASVFGHHILP